MKAVLLVLTLLISGISVAQTVYVTVQDGDYDDVTTVWSTDGGSTVCSCWPGSPIDAADSVVIAHNIVYDNDLSVSGVLNVTSAGTLTLNNNSSLDIELENLASFGGTNPDTIDYVSHPTDWPVPSPRGILFNDGDITIEKDFHIDGYVKNGGNIYVQTDNMHLDGYLCNSGLIEIQDAGSKFDFHGGVFTCCGNIVTAEVKYHDNGNLTGTSMAASTFCGDICGLDGNYPVIDGAGDDDTPEEILQNNNPSDSWVDNSVPEVVTFCGFGVLPVTLTRFECKAFNRSQVNVEWSTNSEYNNSHFELERSIDAGPWEFIGKVEGHGTTSIPREYSFTDQNIHSGLVYYRLRQVDYDGREEYFGPASIEHDHSDELFVYPNPATSVITVVFDGPVDPALIKVLSLTGKSVLDLVDMTSNSEKEILLDLEQLSSGIYIIQLGCISVRFTKR